MARKKELGFDMDSLLQDLISEASTSIDYKGSMPVCEFAEQIIFNGKAELFKPQKAILKAFYGEPLDQEERNILQSWYEETPFQDDPYGRTNWIEDNPYRSLSLEAGRGGPLALDTLVKVPKGYKPISEIKIGDTVFNEKEEPTNVVDLHGPFYDRDVYEITFYSGAKVRCDASHLWPVIGGNRTTRDLIKDPRRRLIIKPLGHKLIKHRTIYDFPIPVVGVGHVWDFGNRQDNDPLFKVLECNNLKPTFINGYAELIEDPNNGGTLKTFDLIKSIELIPTEPVMCIEVDDPKHLFLITENDIPTCNSKSSLGSIFALYEFYKLISMPNPGRHYGLLPNDPIAIFVIAQTLEQVKDTLFAKIRGYAKDSTFFKSLEDAGKIEILSESIRYPAKNVAVYAKHTNSPALVGYTIKAMILDEFSRFENKIEDDGSITSTGDHLWENVGRGVHRFGAEGYRMAISSAWETGDPMERLWQTAQKDDQILAFRLRTWDVNKLASVSRESCNTDYIKDREKAELEFEGVRRKNKSNFINDSMLRDCYKGRSCFSSEEVYFSVGKGKDKRYYVGNEINNIIPSTREDNSSYMHIDFSIKRDCTALCIVSAREIHTENQPKWIISVDGLIRWKPNIDALGRQRFVSYQNVEDIILQICSSRRVSKVTFDQFNSESTIQRLHGLGISTEKLPCTRNAQLDYYTLFRDLCTSDSIRLPTDSQYLTQLVGELTGIIIKPNGQIIHGAAGKDLSDSVVNSVYCCYMNLVKSGLIQNISIEVSTVGSKVKNLNTKFSNGNNKITMGRAIDRLYRKVNIK